MSASANIEVSAENGAPEDPDLLAAFLAHIDGGGLIEPDDWMPTQYRSLMLKMSEHHANSEIVGALPEGEWITRAPNLRRKLALTAKVQDEIGHGQMLYQAAQDLGKPRERMLRDLVTGKTKYHNVFNYPVPTWADVCMIAWLIDGAAILNQGTLAHGAYGPYVRTMRRINMEEAFHFKHGEDMVLTLMSGTKTQRRMGQEAFDRWWSPSIMFFGPPDRPDERERPGMRWRMKTETNDGLRQRFVNRFIPAARSLGLVINIVEKDEHGLVTAKREDPELRFDEDDGNWHYTAPDWDEFKRVIKGRGPCNRQRVGLRRMSFEQGQWVRRAILGGGVAPPTT